MNLRVQTKELVGKEKHYTALILKNLAVMEKQKLYCDYGYPTLFKYLVKELKYSEKEANIRVAAVKLVARSSRAAAKVASGDLNLTNAAQIQGSLRQLEKESGGKARPQTVEKAIGLGLNRPTRDVEKKLRETFKLKTPRTERLTLDGRILEKIDRARKIYGNVSAYELLDILLEEKLKSPGRPLRGRNSAAKNSRYISVKTKDQVNRGKCENCGSRRNLNYDHIHEYAKGGLNSPENIQMLCENCNQRKRIAQIRPPKTM